MNAKSSHRCPSVSRSTTAMLAIVAAFLLVLGGCGDLNGNPLDSGLVLDLQISGSTTGISPQQLVSPNQGTNDEMLTLMVGAVVVSRSTPYTDADLATGANTIDMDILVADATASVQYLAIAQLPHPTVYVSFSIPPDSAGNWQLVAVGLRHRVTSYGQIAADSPVYAGFIPRFLSSADITAEGEILDSGTSLPATLTLQPICSTSYASSPAAPICP